MHGEDVIDCRHASSIVLVDFELDEDDFCVPGRRAIDASQKPGAEEHDADC